MIKSRWREINQIFSLSTTGSKSLLFPHQLSLSFSLSVAAHNTHNLSSIHHHATHMTLKRRRREKIVLDKWVVRQAAVAEPFISLWFYNTKEEQERNTHKQRLCDYSKMMTTMKNRTWTILVLKQRRRPSFSNDNFYYFPSTGCCSPL